MKPEEVLVFIASVRYDFQREEDQALLQHDLHKAEMALAGKYACDRVERYIAARCNLGIVPQKSEARMR